MNKNQIDFIKSLDVECLSGTVQNVLLGNIGDINTLKFENALQYLVSHFKSERDTYQKENKKLRDILIQHNLYDTRVM